MKKYEGTENKYFYDSEALENILNIINTVSYYDSNNLTQEKVSRFVEAVKAFLSSVRQEKQLVLLERHETEEEAREYFGREFIDKFEQLLTTLDKQKTVVAIHGTTIGTCPVICEKGLQYKTPSLTSTAVLQSMNYGQEDMHYGDYEGLLNWKHREYKGLVILAIPYECCYGEGLWERFQETDTSAYGGQDYRINPDFVVGYIDVEGKNIVLNPRYSREHDYTGYQSDMDIFHERSDMDNEKFTQALIDSERQLQQEKSIRHESDVLESDEKREITVRDIPDVISDLRGTFNSIKYGFPKAMSEERYKYLLHELSLGFDFIQDLISSLKTDEQVAQERAEVDAMFNGEGTNDSDWDDLSWDEILEEEAKSSKGI